MSDLDYLEIKTIVENALEEDVVGGDITTNTLIPFDLECRAEVLVKEDCVLAGIPVAIAVFKSFDSTLIIDVLEKDSASVKAGTIVLTVEGKARSILTCERTVLNFLQRLSGIATVTRSYVDACATDRVKILDTRKTTPLLRYLEKYAVRMGGGENHRYGLFDQFLIKDNHLKLLKETGKNPISFSVITAKKYSPSIPVEIEVEQVEDIEEAVEAGCDIILLDNMSPETIQTAVDIVKGRVLTEASGGITLENVAEYAQTGVDRISIGALTHSARSVDISLDIVE